MFAHADWYGGIALDTNYGQAITSPASDVDRASSEASGWPRISTEAALEKLTLDSHSATRQDRKSCAVRHERTTHVASLLPHF
jgi:hypothetical protein